MLSWCRSHTKNTGFCGPGHVKLPGTWALLNYFFVSFPAIGRRFGVLDLVHACGRRLPGADQLLLPAPHQRFCICPCELDCRPLWRRQPFAAGSVVEGPLHDAIGTCTSVASLSCLCPSFAKHFRFLAPITLEIDFFLPGQQKQCRLQGMHQFAP